MPFFANPEEVDKYLGGIFREAADHPEVGPKLKAADLDMKVVYEDPECELNVEFREPMVVTSEVLDNDPDITLYMPGDIADKFWRGEYNLAVGLAKGQVKAKGPVNKILKLAGMTKPLFPIYKDLIAEKDGAAA